MVGVPLEMCLMAVKLSAGTLARSLGGAGVQQRGWGTLLRARQWLALTSVSERFLHFDC